MKKIFENNDDLHVVARVIYAKTGDTKAYADEKHTQTIDAATLKDLFVKGCLIVNGENIYKPIAMNQKNNATTISYMTASPSAASTAVLATLVSTEPAA